MIQCFLISVSGHFLTFELFTCERLNMLEWVKLGKNIWLVHGEMKKKLRFPLRFFSFRFFCF